MNNFSTIIGVWKLHNTNTWVNGLLQYDADKRTITLVLYFKNTNIPANCSFSGERICYIIGKLPNGEYISLFNCLVQSEKSNLKGDYEITIGIEYAFEGLNPHSIDELTFKGVVVDFGEILNWYDICHFERPLPKEGEDICYYWKTGDLIEWKYNDNLTIHFFSTIAHSSENMYKRECILKQNVLVEFKYTEDVPWETVLHDIQVIQYLIGFGMEQVVEIESIRYCHSSQITELEKEEFYPTTLDVMIGTGIIPSQKYIRPDRFLFSFKDFLEIENGTKRWIESYEKAKPILDLLLSLPAIKTAEMSFLVLTQALETLHARFFAKTLGDYRTRVGEIISNIMDGTEKEKVKGFLIEDNPKNILLKHRLSDLFYAEGANPIFLYGNKLEDYIQKTADTRNYYTHYNEDKREKSFSPKELRIAMIILLSLLDYHLLVIAGFKNEFVKKKIDRKIKLIREDLLCTLPELSCDTDDNT